MEVVLHLALIPLLAEVEVEMTAFKIRRMVVQEVELEERHLEQQQALMQLLQHKAILAVVIQGIHQTHILRAAAAVQVQ
jgi:hypothetical protein